MKLLTPIAAIVSLAAAGQVFHAPADVYQNLEFQAHSPLFQLQQLQQQQQHHVQHIPQVHEEQHGFDRFQGLQFHQGAAKSHQSIQVQAPQVSHQVQHVPQMIHQIEHTPQISHQVHHTPQISQVHFTPQISQVHHTPQISQVHHVPQIKSPQIQQQTQHIPQIHQVHHNFHSHQEQDHQSHSGHSTHAHHDGVDKVAKTISHQHDTDGHNYQYAFETDNGIKMQEVGSMEGKGAQMQGAYSYTGDDGHIYTVTYTADENGFHAEGAHLPTPPPMPEAIARSIEQNLKDEANGIIDEGHYQPHHHEGHQQQVQGHQQPRYQQQSFQHHRSFGEPAPITEYH